MKENVLNSIYIWVTLGNENGNGPETVHMFRRGRHEKKIMELM